jgi:uncharacterized protein YkwD
MMAHKPLVLIMALAVLLTSCTTVPATATPPGQTPGAPTSQPSLTPAPTTGVTTTEPTPVAPAAPLATPTKVQYTVHSGDTLLGIALLQRVSMAAIQLANGLGDGDVLRAGQVLDLPTRPQWDGESPYWVVHTVQRGETLTGIARTFGVTTRDILRVNAIADPQLIRPGQSIVIPLDSLRVAAEPPPTPEPTTAPTILSPLANPSPRPITPTALPTLIPAPVSSDIAAWATTVVTLINQKRAANGLPPYSLAPELMRSAQAQAADCTARGWCGHIGSDGSDTRAREVRAGYNPTVWGENWVQARDPVKAVEWWYNETPPNDPHRKNLLHTRYNQVGVGITQSENGYYFIADFGRR